MKTHELIKQAEELLGKCIKAESASDDIIMKDVAFEEAAHLAVFARNHMREIIDKMKKYEEALKYFSDVMDTIENEKLKDGDQVENILLNYAIYSEARHKAREALEEE